MGIITDILKEIPLSAVLRERLADQEIKMATLEAENAALKSENTVLKSKFESSQNKGVRTGYQTTAKRSAYKTWGFYVT
jgi:cell division protein FtsB